MHAPLAAALAAFTLVLASYAAPAAADTVLAVEPAAPKISAAGGAAAWSTFDRATGTWFLVIRQGGAQQRATASDRARHARSP